jgi:hypothetical protein
MKTFIAAFAALALFTGTAMACPHTEEQKQAEKKEPKADTTKQAKAPKATPAPAQPAKPKAPATKSETPKADAGKVSSR